MRILAVLFFLLWVLPCAEARGPAGTLSVPTFQDDGDSRIPFRVVVGSELPVALFTSDALKDRAVLIYNLNSNFDLLLGTWSAFTMTDSWWLVPASSGSWGSAAHGIIWALYPPGAASDTVRGLLEKQ